MNTLVALLLVCAASMQAAVITYQGQDPGAGPGDPTPLSDAARAAFIASLGGATSYVLDFESIPIQYSNTIDLTTMELQLVGTTSEANGGVTAGEDTLPSATLGFNTTPGGSRFLRLVPAFDIGTAGLRILFASPVEFFGTNITGLGTDSGSLMIDFNNGTPQSFALAGDVSGGANFFGFTTFGEPVTEVSLLLSDVTGFSRDIFAVDDIVTGLQPTPIPEPGTWALMAGGLGAVLIRRRLS